MTGPRIDPEEIPGWLDKYFANLQAAHSLPAADATAVKAPPRFQAPATATIGAQGPGYPAAQFNPLYSAYGGIHDFLAKRVKGYSPKDAFGDVANASGAKDIFQGLGNANAGQLAGGVLAAATLPLGGEGKAAGELGALKHQFAHAAENVDGRLVGKEVHNLSSIGATFKPGEYSIDDGIREIPLTAFESPTTMDPRKLSPRARDVAAQIQANNRVDPLIVAVDKDGPYILEGAHRYDALRSMGAKSFPAKVVRELGSKGAPAAAQTTASTRTAAKTAFQEVEPGQFHDALSTFAKVKPDKAGFITWRSPEEMSAEGMRTYLSPDKKTGYAIHPESGDIRNVFNIGAPGAGAHAVADAVANRGGKILDAFDTNLGNFYRDFGFDETGRMPWDDQYRPSSWDASHGTPDVIAMQHPLAGAASDKELLKQYEMRRAIRKGEIPVPKPGVPPSFRVPIGETSTRARMRDVEDMVRALELNRPTPFTPEPRGVFDRTNFDPDFRMRDGENTMPPARGKFDEELANRLDSKKVRGLMQRQVNLGLGLGGRGFYNLEPVKASFEDMGGGLRNSFEDFNAASSAGSIQAPLPLELSNANLMLYAKANGISYDQAKAAMAERYPHFPSPWLSKTHTQTFEKYLGGGSIDPISPTSGGRKVPTYNRTKLGESAATSSPVFDTHESKALLYPLGLDDYVQNLTGSQYETVGDFYRTLAKRMGLRVDQVQAGRWFGGGSITGLKSPRGDYLQQVENMLKYTAQQTGRDESPAGLRKLWFDVTQGHDFLAPYYGKGALPIK